MNSALKSLVMAARQHGVDLSVDRLAHEYTLGGDEPDDALILKIANENNLTAKVVKIGWEKIVDLGSAFPVIARLKNNRFVIIAGYDGKDVDNEGVFVLNPLDAKPTVESVPRDKFLALWSGSVILVKRYFGLTDDEQPFSVRWIIGEFLKQKVLMLQLLLVSVILHVFALLPIIYIMIVLDKVINYEAYSTLYVIAAGVGLAFIFNGVLGYLRKYIALFFTTKFDVKLNINIFSRLLDLPMSYFQQHSASKVIKTMQQTATIRSFLMGKLFSTVLDATALLIFVPILFMYSPILSITVYIFAGLISLNIVFSSRRQKDALKNVSTYDGKKQDILLNSISGIATVKSLAIESVQKKAWEEYSTRHIIASMEQGKGDAVSAQINGTLQQLMTVAVIFVGVILVFEGSLSAGVLIGANMLAGRIVGPLTKLVSMATEMQRVSTAIKLVGSVLNKRGESRGSGIAPDIIGGVEFNDVGFSYKDGEPGLSNISFTIKPRQKVAIVGPSGSGKTTLARLIQSLLVPQEGSIFVDGNDLRLINRGHFRVNVSSVSQDNAFFAETIRESLIRPMPNATSERLLWASNLIGLHGDVEAMPQGYETMLEEGAANISSGQRQKIAIARALIRNPKIFIMDEAFSNLGLDDELSLLKNMPEINLGRTLIIVTHRLPQIVDSDLILVMDKGKLVESGSHSELLAGRGLYYDLWQKETMLEDVKT